MELTTIADTIHAVSSRTVSPAEVVTEAIERIERVNPKLNAVVTTRFDAALAEATNIPTDQPLSGLPILLKDVALTGEPSYYGNRAYANLDTRYARTDVFVHRLQAAGAIVLGYTNLPEFTSAPTTESVLYGPCRNPWQTEHSAGGSSGGAGSAVAARMVPAAQSSDGGGSSRIPASATGTFTIKTSRGRTPLTPSGAAWADILSSVSFITNTVEDFARLLDVIVGVEPDETVGAPAGARPFLSEVGADPGTLRIGVTSAATGRASLVDSASTAALTTVAATLSDLGHKVEEAAPKEYESDESLALIRTYWPLKVAARAFSAEQLLGRSLDANDVEPMTLALLNAARGTNLVDFARAQAGIREFSIRAISWWRDFDLLLTPTTPSQAPRLGVLDGASPDGRAAISSWTRYMSFANITGQPAASVPVRREGTSLPVGVQLVAAPHREDVLLRVCAQLERTSAWLRETPPLCA
jgi:amidase